MAVKPTIVGRNNIYLFVVVTTQRASTMLANYNCGLGCGTRRNYELEAIFPLSFYSNFKRYLFYRKIRACAWDQLFHGLI